MLSQHEDERGQDSTDQYLHIPFGYEDYLGKVGGTFQNFMIFDRGK